MKDLIYTVTVPDTDNKYKEIAGVDTREEYLYNVAEEYDVDNETVHFLADILGESEDFDSLISMLKDIKEESDD